MKSPVRMLVSTLEAGPRVARAFLILLSCCAAGCAPAPEATSPHPVEEVVGCRARIVWCRQVVGDGKDAMGGGPGFVLMGIDTRDGQGERVILGEVSSYRKPLFDPTGERIIYSNRPEHEMRTVRWDGTGLEVLGPGMVLDVWGDPDTGVTWIYYVRDVKDNLTTDGHPVRRLQLDRPEVDEPVWDRTWVSADSFQVSADGRIAAGQFPWRDAGVAELAAGTLHITGQGCWTGLTPDNSYRMWFLDGAHKSLLVKDFGAGSTHKVRLNSAPGTETHEIYHPRWSNHPRILAITGPYRIQGQHTAIYEGGKGINLYVGRFTPAFDGIEAWAQVTQHEQADFFPDVWVEEEGVASADVRTTRPPPLAPAPALWPTTHDGLVFVWEHAKAPNRIRGEEGAHATVCQVVRRGQARLTRHFEADLDGGWIEPADPDAGLTAALNGDGPLSLELLLTPVVQRETEAGFIAQLASKDGQERLALIQRGMQLGLRLPSVAALSPHRVEAGVPVHLVLVLDGGSWSVYRNGAEAGSVQAAAPGGADVALRLGRNALGQSDWRGAIGGIAVYRRALSYDEIAAHWRYAQEKTAARTPAPRLVFRGTLVEKTDSPLPEAIRPYRDGLVEYVYEVVEVLEGACEEERIIVQHWAILDGISIPIDSELGGTHTVHAESVYDHPELEGERVSSTVEDPLLEVYVDIAPLPRGNEGGE